MPRYNIEVLVRNEGASRDERQGEFTLMDGVTAKSELAARRTTMERAWANGLLVSRFLRVIRKTTT